MKLPPQGETITKENKSKGKCDVNAVTEEPVTVSDKHN